jgi:hypothetical protein
MAQNGLGGVTSSVPIWTRILWYGVNLYALFKFYTFVYIRWCLCVIHLFQPCTFRGWIDMELSSVAQMKIPPTIYSLRACSIVKTSSWHGCLHRVSLRVHSALHKREDMHIHTFLVWRGGTQCNMCWRGWNLCIPYLFYRPRQDFKHERCSFTVQYVHRWVQNPSPWVSKWSWGIYESNQVKNGRCLQHNLFECRYL